MRYQGQSQTVFVMVQFHLSCIAGGYDMQLIQRSWRCWQHGNSLQRVIC
jgi:hypothetical protein